MAKAKKAKKATKQKKRSIKKTFVLDTNVLLHDHSALTKFQDNNIVLPMTVIEELDRFKTYSDELGKNARATIRELDAYRKTARASDTNLSEGVVMLSRGTLRIELNNIDVLKEIRALDLSIPDNRIIAVAYNLSKDIKNVVFVSMDFNARLKADVLNVEVQEYTAGQIISDELYSGWRHQKVPGEAIDKFYTDKVLELEGKFTPNEFVLLENKTDSQQTAIVRYNKKSEFVKLSDTYDVTYGVTARSKQQRMATELLLDSDVELVTLIGQAGTGKTLLAIAAALECVVGFNKYDRILISRPIIPMGKDIGYLPGGKEEKMTNWMQPIFDNLEYLFSRNKNNKKKEKVGGREEDSVKKKIDKLLQDNILELEALTYIRGRSIPRQYVIIDEAQNLTPHEVKTIISRAGEGTKIVLTGDPYQIDNPYLDSTNNGLVFVQERMRHRGVTGHVTLEKVERSGLAAAATEDLQI